jgi:conjugative transposon TraK protein
MFPKTKNIESSFHNIRLICMTTIIGSFGFTALCLFRYTKAVDKAQERIYILSSGKAMEAFASSRREDIPVEARDHIASFHDLFFTLDPDEKVIDRNLGKALYLADGSAKRVYENLKESGYYSGVISANISQRVEIDSIHLNMDSYPFYFRCYGLETITRTTSIVSRSLITEGWLRNVSRSDNSPHGLLIERWSILENKDLKVEPR